MKKLILAMVVGVVGCASLSALDSTALQTSTKLTASAICDLPDGGGTRAKMMAARAGELGILRRAGIDAGSPFPDCEGR